MIQIGFQVNTKLAKLLAENYRSSEKALKELVDNAWDADAELVEITIPESLTMDPIIIEDDGSGMTEEEIKSEYLNIASPRRLRRGEFTTKKHRKVKGKKGIGKFAGLMAASCMKLETWARDVKSEISLKIEDFDTVEDIEKLPIALKTSKSVKEQKGTRITLSSLNQSLSFPDPDKLRQLLLQEYGREDDFIIKVNEKNLDVDDIKGTYTEVKNNLKNVGDVKLRFTISNQKGKLRQPGISIRIGGKVIGKPDFFGLDSADDFPNSLLNKIYGEVEADGLLAHVTADDGALIENSKLFKELENYVQPLIRTKVKEEYGREIQLAQARLKKNINDRLSQLPEHKRFFADKAIKSVLNKYYGEPESKVEPIVNVLLDALERSDYRAVLDYINSAKHSDIAKIAEVLKTVGLEELAIIGEQTKARIEFLNTFEELCSNIETTEKMVHDTLERSLWILGAQYSVFSSNITLKKQVEDYLGKKYSGTRAKKRPDLLLNVNFNLEYLIIEFKRPNHILTHDDYQQATRYRNDFIQFTDKKIRLFLIGGKRGKSLPSIQNIEPGVDILLFSEIISMARKQLEWLLMELKEDRV